MKFNNFAAPSSPPQNITGTALSSLSILLMWSPPPLDSQNGIIVQYRVNITEINTGDVFSLVSYSTSIHVQFLHPYYTYVCIISAVTIEEGPYSEGVTVTTSEDGK